MAKTGALFGCRFGWDAGTTSATMGSWMCRAGWGVIGFLVSRPKRWKGLLGLFLALSGGQLSCSGKAILFPRLGGLDARSHDPPAPAVNYG